MVKQRRHAKDFYAFQDETDTTLATKAPLASPTFTGTVVLPSTTSIGTVSNTEIGYLDGVTSALQTQIDAKQATLVSGTNIKSVNGTSILGSGDLSVITATFGPYYINDITGTGTSEATLGYFNTGTALSRNANALKMQSAGRIIGMVAVSDDARTAGTATIRARINGTGVDFASGAVVLDGTNTTSDSAFVSKANGVAFAAGDTIGAEVVTSGWTPITADLAVWIVVEINPF